MACAGGFDDRRLALLAPTTPRVMIRAHVGGIAKEDLRFFPLRKGFDLRVFLLEPLLDQGIVTLLRAVHRLLASAAELRQQSTNRIGAQRRRQTSPGSAWRSCRASTARTQTSVATDSSLSRSCRPIAWRGHSIWAVFQTTAWPSKRPIHLADIAPTIRISSCD